MLGNNSIEIAGQQRARYDGMLGFVKAIARCKLTSSLVHHARPVYCSRGRSLVNVSFKPEAGNKSMPSRPNVRDKGPALATLLRTLADQGRSILEHSCNNSQAFSDQNGRDILDISKKLIELSDKFSQGMPPTTDDVNLGERPRTTESFKAWHEQNAVQAIEDEAILNGFTFESPARKAVGKAVQFGRTKRLITELSNLRSSLPEGIFIRHGSSRVDVMKILIIGARGTPYEHGFFEFDLFCPPDYPKYPPTMKLLTTNGGNARFNPNLYEDGTSKLHWIYSPVPCGGAAQFRIIKVNSANQKPRDSMPLPTWYLVGRAVAAG